MTDKTYKDFTSDELKDLEIHESYDVFLNSYNALPQEIIDHRKYFSSEGRGFGEDAFHAMWYYIFEKYAPKNIIEIGVFRGQTLSLFSLLGRHFGYEINAVGISPLEAVNDSVSQFPTHVNYEEDIKTNFAHFNLGEPKLFRASSIEKKARRFIKSQKWDLIYIDGNHDMPYVLSDYMNCADAITDNGLLCIDDSSLYRNFSREGSFPGHVAPSQIADQVAALEMDRILTVGHNNIFQNTL